MFKKLKNRILLINMLMISTLMVLCVCMIYFIAANRLIGDINNRLSVAVSFMESKKDDVPPHHRNNEDVRKENQKNQKKEHKFEPIIAVCIDQDYNITDKNTDLMISGYIDDNTLLENAKKIITQKEKNGSVYMLNSRWDYKLKRTDSGYIIAMGQFSAEHKALLTLLLVSSPVCFAVVMAAYFISLYNANRYIRPIEESYNSQKQFIANASHELKTPLTTINANIDVLLSHKEKTIEEEQKWLYYIKSEANRMNELTNDLLYLAQLTHDNNDIFPRVSFSENVENVILSMEAVAFEKNICIEENIEKDVYVNASDALIKQLATILLDNAIKYTPHDGSISVSLNGGELKVKNSGKGISLSNQNQIFERFFRLDESRSRENGGYGLGLSIAKAICDKLKGNISVYSRENEYTEFTVKLPLSNEKQHD